MTLAAVRFDAHDPAALGRFWGGLLDRDVAAEAHAVLLPADGTQVGLRFLEASSNKSGPNALHLHLTSTDPSDQRRTVERALDLGGHHLDVGQRPEEGHVVLADPEGNEFCVIEPGEGWLAGTGFLGEVTCVGSRNAGMFWRDALGWPLVWDRGEQTAVQSPLGGTKLSWDALDLALHRGRRRQTFDLVASGGGVAAGATVAAGGTPTPGGTLAADAERLVALGASRLHADDDVWTLADPDGTEFHLTRDAAVF